MNLNQVRLLEACYTYLLNKTCERVKKELAGCKMVFSFNNSLLTFKTYETKYDSYDFVENVLGELEQSVDYRSLSNVKEIYNAINVNNYKLESLRMIEEPEIAKKIIFKLLTQVDLESLEQNYPEIKANNFIYEVHNLTINANFACMQLPKNATLELIAIA